MPGFIRRFDFIPGLETITEIEGVNIIDLPPPGSVEGVSTGVVCCVGEFADMSLATSVDGSGVVTTRVQPQEIFSAADMLAQFGGFDETIGDFGGDGGSAFAALRGKRFSRLILAAVNLCSSLGVRFTRQLPLCSSTTNVLPVVPVTAAAVAAGREFTNGQGGRLKAGARVQFTAFAAIATGVGGATTNAASAAAQTFTVAGENFAELPRPEGGVGIKKGDIIVIGNNNAGALQPLPAGGNLGAGTYRVAADALPASPTVLQLERLDGANFAFVTAATIPWRIHVSSDADSAPVIVTGNSQPGGYAAAEMGGYTVPCRPLTDEDGAPTDGAWTTLLLQPRIAPPALTGSSADPLSGLQALLQTGGIQFTAAVQAPNALSGSAIDALYAAAIEETVSEAEPLNSIDVIFAARTTATIRTALRQNAALASAASSGRMAIIRPSLSVQSLSTVLGDAAPGVGALRAERVIYAWPGERTFIREAVETRLRTADGQTTIDGVLDMGFDARVASLISNLPPERNIGQGLEPVPSLMAGVAGFQRGAPKLEKDAYIALRARGVVALRVDKTVGPIVQSAVTTSLISGQKNISRRRMADFIQDSLAERTVNFSKLPLTADNQDNIVAEATAFLDELLSEGNRAAARIAGYTVDDVSGNTPSSLARGVFVVIVRVRLIPTGDFIVLQTEIGENVSLVSELAAA